MHGVDGDLSTSRIKGWTGTGRHGRRSRGKPRHVQGFSAEDDSDLYYDVHDCSFNSLEMILSHITDMEYV